MDDNRLIQNSEEFTPTIIRNILLLSPGKWNNVDYTELEIQKAYHATDWNDRKFRTLYLDHQDTKERGVANFGGFVQNPRLEGSALFGDLEIWNPMVALWLSKAKAKFGISATLAGRENKRLEKMEDFHFESFSIVTDPACKPAMINLASKEASDMDIKVVLTQNETNLESVKHKERREDAENKCPFGLKHGNDDDSKFDIEQLKTGIEVEKEHSDDPDVAKAIAKAHLAEIPDYYTRLKEMEEKTSTLEIEKLATEELAKITGFETERKKKGMSPAEFYAVPRDPPSSSSLPIFDAAHVRNAIARFGQTHLSPEEKASAWRKIKKAASKFDIEIKENTEELDAIFDRQVSHIMDSLRHYHPEWSEAKIKRVAYATATKMKEQEEKTNEEKIDKIQSLSESPRAGDVTAEVVKQLASNNISPERESSDIKLLKGGIKMPEIIENGNVATLENEESKAKKMMEEAKKMMEEANKKLEEAKKLEESCNSKKLEEAKKSNEESESKKKKDKKDDDEKDDEAKDKSKDKETILNEISKKMQEMESKIKELTAKVKTPDRKTLSVAFDSNANDSNLGMVRFLQQRID